MEKVENIELMCQRTMVLDFRHELWYPDEENGRSDMLRIA